LNVDTFSNNLFYLSGITRTDKAEKRCWQKLKFENRTSKKYYTLIIRAWNVYLSH